MLVEGRGVRDVTLKERHSGRPGEDADQLGDFEEIRISLEAIDQRSASRARCSCDLTEIGAEVEDLLSLEVDPVEKPSPVFSKAAGLKVTKRDRLIVVAGLDALGR